MNGYHWITLRGETGSDFKQSFYIHRLMWELFVGPIPPSMEVDHINRDRGDCRLENLRLATSNQNSMNKVQPRMGRVPYRGVTFEAGRYRARIRHGGKKLHIGLFDSAEKAAEAYDAAAERLHDAFAITNGADVLGKFDKMVEA
jgi:hypothetical protein